MNVFFSKLKNFLKTFSKIFQENFPKNNHKSNKKKQASVVHVISFAPNMCSKKVGK
jgi:hypothetical protein